MQLARPMVLAAALACALPGHAILIRADRDDAEYLELATRYESALRLDPAAGGGVLIAPRWILTEASVASRLDATKPGARLRIGSEEAEVERVFIAPDAGVGLVMLKSAAKGPQPSALYRGRDEAGKAVVIASCGPTGRIGDAARHSDRRCRAAINTVDRVSDATLELRIKAPDDASDLQGAAVDEDRGSPLYVESQGGILVAGIAAKGKDAPRVGDSNLYFRVSTLVPWIEETMLEEAKREMNRLLDDSGRG